MADITLPITYGNLPAGSCFSDAQQFVNALGLISTVTVPKELSSVIISDTEPTADQRDRLWAQTSSGNLVGVFAWSSTYGLWVAEYPVPPGANGYRMLWADTLGALATFDGGDAGAITDVTGAFWVEDTTITDKIPIAAGALAVNTNSALLVGDTGTKTSVRGIYFAKRSSRIYKVAP